VRSDLGAFWRALRAQLGGAALPYLWVPEWHPGGHGLHAHFAVGQYVRHSLIKQAWGRGHVHIKRLTDLPVGSTTWDEARKAAGYLSKYVTKTFTEDLGGLHRFDVAQGFQPQVQRLHGISADDLLAQAITAMGAAPSVRWSSAEKVGWQGPPAVWFAWA
jgi:hypothetical protein